MLPPSGDATGVATLLHRSYDEVINRLNEPVKKEPTRQAGTSSQTLTQTADGGASTPESILLTAKGAMTRSPETGQALISLFKGKADVSTIIHEGAGHFFLENLRDAACLENAPQWVKDAWATVAREIGCDIDPHVDIATEAHEKFAHMAVQYFREGKSPTPLLTGVFQRFVRWLTDICRAIVRSGDTAELSPEIRKVFDRLLASEDEIRSQELNRKLAGTRNTDADALRAGLDGRGKRDVLRAQEKALADVQAGEPVDVSGVLQDSPAVSRQVPSPDGEQASVRPDWSVERQDAAEPAPAEPVTEDAARQADKQSMEAGMAEVDARMEQLERQGLITEDDRAALKPYDDDVARAENAGEAGLGVVECVIRAAE